MRPAALDDDDRAGGRSADRAGFAVELDGERVLGDVDADDAAGVDATKRDLLPADGDHAGGADPALNRDRLASWPRWRAGGPRALEPHCLLVGERVGADAQ